MAEVCVAVNSLLNSCAPEESVGTWNLSNSGGARAVQVAKSMPNSGAVTLSFPGQFSFRTSLPQPDKFRVDHTPRYHFKSPRWLKTNNTGIAGFVASLAGGLALRSLVYTLTRPCS